MSAERGLTAVIAEDDFLVSTEVVRVANSIGIKTVAVAADGDEAVDAVKRFAPSVAILDIQMPRATGIEVARRLREACPTPVVILTAFETAEFIREATEAGVGAYITKPPKASDLWRAVQIAVARHAELLEMKRLNDELRRALDEVGKLQSLLGVCMYCKKIRDDEGTWQQLEAYMYAQSRTRVSHGVCPDCLERGHGGRG